MLVLRRVENRSIQRKTSRSKGENQQRTQPNNQCRDLNPGIINIGGRQVLLPLHHPCSNNPPFTMGESLGSGLSKVAGSWLPVKIAPYLVSIGRLFCLAFLYRWSFLNKISLDWPLTLTTEPSTSKLSENPVGLISLYRSRWWVKGGGRHSSRSWSRGLTLD